MRKLLGSIILISVFLAVTARVNAYPSFIGYGYTSCVVCHYNAFGNGPLTDYGRALGATAIAAKPIYNLGADDDTLGAQSGFLGSVPLPSHLRLSANYRGMYLMNDALRDTRNSRYIHMQGEGSLIYRMSGDDTKVLMATVGYLPPAAGIPRTDGKIGIIAREYYYLHQINRNFRLYTGLQDVVFGIRIPDHIATSRTTTKLGQNDQVHGVVLHGASKSTEFGLHAIVGNLQQEAGIRPLGMSFMAEMDAMEKVRLGMSGLVSTSKARNRRMAALHLRAGAGQGSSALLEMGFVQDALKGASGTLGSYLFTQTMSRVARGLHVLFTGEYKTADTFRPNVRYFRVGPSLQFFPMQRLELRADFLGSRSMGGPPNPNSTIVENDTFSFLSQVHFWF